MKQDILIIGAGVIGLMCALECERSGASVTVLDKSLSGREASWAGGGILSPLYPWMENQAVQALYPWSARQYEFLASELLDQTGIDIEWNRCGMLYRGLKSKHSAEQFLTAQSISYEWLDSSRLRQLYHGLQVDHEPALLVPSIAQLRNPRLLKALKQLLVQRRVNLLEYQNISKLKFNGTGTKIASLQSQDKHFQADTIIVAAGAWSPQLLPEISTNPGFNIHPVKGQMLLFKTKPGDITSIIIEDNRYLIPRNDGHVLVGSSVEQTQYEKTRTVTARRELKQFFSYLYPGFGNLPVISHWAGIRPGIEWHSGNFTPS